MKSTIARNRRRRHFKRRSRRRRSTRPRVRPSASPTTRRRPSRPHQDGSGGFDDRPHRLRGHRRLSSPVPDERSPRPACPWVKVNPRQARRFARGRGQTRQDRPLRRPHARPHGRSSRALSRILSAQHDDRGHEGTRQRPRRPRSRTASPPSTGRLIAVSAAHQASARSEAAPDRQPDRGHRQATSRRLRNGRRRSQRALRHPDEHSKRRRGDRQCADGRDARARASRP